MRLVQPSRQEDHHAHAEAEVVHVAVGQRHVAVAGADLRALDTSEQASEPGSERARERESDRSTLRHRIKVQQHVFFSEGKAWGEPKAAARDMSFSAQKTPPPQYLDIRADFPSQTPSTVGTAELVDEI